MRLLIFKVNQLGDNVVYLPVVQELRKRLADWEITVFTSPVAEPLYQRCCKDVTVKTFATRHLNDSWRAPWRLPSLISATRQVQADVCLFGEDQSNVAYLMGKFSGARKTIGPRWQKIPLTALITHPVHLDFDESVAIQNWKLASALLAEENLPAFDSGLPPVPDLSAFGCDEHGSILIHPGASSARKRWPLERFIRLANQLCQHLPLTWVLQGWPEEEQLDASVRKIGMGSLESFIQKIAGARLFIGNNSGPMNIAAALGIPSIIINGRSPAKWDPIWHRSQITQLKDTEALPQQDAMAGKKWDVDTIYELALSKLSAS